MVLPPDPLDYSPTAGGVNLPLCSAGLPTQWLYKYCRSGENGGQIYSRVIGADQRRTCFVASDAETLPVLAQQSLSFLI
jgi:hypothetical protein